MKSASALGSSVRISNSSLREHSRTRGPVGESASPHGGKSSKTKRTPVNRRAQAKDVDRGRFEQQGESGVKNLLSIHNAVDVGPTLAKQIPNESDPVDHGPVPINSH